jgi:hypothetical protein
VEMLRLRITDERSVRHIPPIKVITEIYILPMNVAVGDMRESSHILLMALLHILFG